jgi:hypothetical protein
MLCLPRTPEGQTRKAAALRALDAMTKLLMIARFLQKAQNISWVW